VRRAWRAPPPGPDDRVAHRRARRLRRVRGQRDELGAGRQVRPLGPGVVAEHRCARDDDQVMCLELLPNVGDRHPQGPLVAGMVGREGDPADLDRQQGRCRQPLGRRHPSVPSARRVDLGPEDEERAPGRVQALGEGRDRLGLGSRTSGDLSLVSPATSPPASPRQSWSGTDTKTGPVGALAARRTARASVAGTVVGDGAPKEPLTGGLGRLIASTFVSCPSSVISDRVCWPLMRTSGDLRVDERPHRLADARGRVQADQHRCPGRLRVGVRHRQPGTFLSAPARSGSPLGSRRGRSAR
jgi:hypothetical protein